MRAARTPLATSGRFCRRILLERLQDTNVSPGQRNQSRTTPAENRPEVRNPWQNRRPFPAKPPRSRGGTGRVQGKARQKALPNTRTHLRPLFMRAGHPDTSTPCVLAALSPTRPAKQLKSRKARPRKQSRQPDDSAPCPLVPRCCPGPGMARPVNSSTEAAVGRDISRSPLQRIVGTSGRKRHEERSHGRRNS